MKRWLGFMLGCGLLSSSVHSLPTCFTQSQHQLNGSWEARQTAVRSTFLG
jgi:hypothetical protein